MINGKLGVGIIGLSAGKSHLVAYKENPYTDVKGLCDTDRARLEKVANEYKIPFATNNYKELVLRNEIDSVSIATPDFFHKEQSVFALNAGKNVLCEKPLALNLKDCRAIIDASKKSKAKFMVGQVCRFTPGFILAKKLIEEGNIGDLFFVESEYAHDYRELGGIKNWRKNPERHPFIGGGCHSVDLLRWIGGDVKEVFAYSNHKCLLDWPVDDCTIAVFKFKNEVIGKVFCSIGCIRPYTMRSILYGTKGTIICDNSSSFIQISSKNLSTKKHPPFEKIPVNIASHDILAELNEFVDCIIKDKSPVINAEEGAKTVSVCVSVVKSAKEGKPIKVESAF